MLTVVKTGEKGGGGESYLHNLEGNKCTEHLQEAFYHYIKALEEQN